MDSPPTTPARVSYMRLEPPAPSPEKSPSSYTPEKIQDRLCQECQGIRRHHPAV
ncbi:hypothetical protein GJ744_003444 [Endocarpon pusillum]|uniref:Uncharacterized protein n=1 Tax=Endocarpon pusillum TaxID=364733 RepID=A0A8H7DZC9_9EURO|nr:hypothetical protein GJ744_003444 [Endocarpon pusillum]